MPRRWAWSIIITSRATWCFFALVTWQVTTGAADAVAQRRGRGVRLGPARPEAGLRVGYDLTGKGPGAGGQIKVPLGALDLMPSADWIASGTREGWQVNIDGALRLGRLQAAYVGGGVGIANSVSKPNIFFGLSPHRRVPGRAAHGYFEARWTLTDPSRFIMVLGLNFRLGG